MSNNNSDENFFHSNFEFIELEESKYQIWKYCQENFLLFNILMLPLLQTSLENPRLFNPKEKYVRVIDYENVLEFKIIIN